MPEKPDDKAPGNRFPGLEAVMGATAEKHDLDPGYRRAASSDGHILAFPLQGKTEKKSLKDVLARWLFPTARLGV